MILVTGANGFLGGYLLEALVSAGHPVKATYRKQIPMHLQELNNVLWLQADLLDVTRVDEILENVTQVYHCAAMISYDRKQRDTMIDQNVQSTSNLVNACLEHGIEKLLHVSSIAALGKNEATNEVTEEEAWEESHGKSAYGISKYLSEMEVWRGIGEGLNAVIINPGIILGPGDWKQGSAALMTTVANGLKYYPLGTTGWVDVRDVARAMMVLMNSEVSAQRFIIVEDNYAFKEIFGLMADALLIPGPGIAVKPWQTNLFWRWEAVKSFITGRPTMITKESAETAQRTAFYINEKFKQAFPHFSYKPMEDTIDHMAQAYKMAQ